ncbi:hypothetical protein BC834DRAFT_956256 [Gloeopeniophorella convolvens]|nr:hypothetical protein BC834DRAFT_956256 [Gloeopeniophorella convolvens]
MIPITQVCRYWHQVALANGSLWATIRGYDLKAEWCAAVFARSKGAPLDLKLLAPCFETLPVVSQHMSRIRGLCLRTLEVPIYHESMRPLLGSEAPALEKFAVEVRVPDLDEPFDPPEPFKLFNGHAPKLRQVALQFVRAPWTSLPRCSLTHLRVISDPSLTQDLTSGTMDELFDLLTNTPSLEVLELDNCLPPDIPQPASARHVVLPHLRRLILADSSLGVMHVFQSLDMPSLRSLRLFFLAEDSEDAEFWSTMISLAISRLKSTFRSLCFHFDTLAESPYFDRTYATMTIKACEALLDTYRCLFPSDFVFPSRPWVAEEDIDLVLKFEFPIDSLSATDIVQLTCNSLRMEALNFVNINAPTTIQVPDWAYLLRECTDLTALEVRGIGTRTLLGNLREPRATLPGPSDVGSLPGEVERTSTDAPSKEADNAEGGALLFPNLKFLFVRGYDFVKPCGPDGGSLFPIIRDIAQLRHGAGAPLELLSLNESTVCDEDMDDLSLAKLDLDVEWGESGDPSVGPDEYGGPINDRASVMFLDLDSW